VPLHGTKNDRCTCGDQDCKKPGRHPRTPNGIDDATSKTAIIKKHWTQWPNAKIGIATGAPGWRARGAGP
jgi:Bifunctional DNA primase/polymerase, N-terminal